ncbi:hypothetical protein CAP36_11360 [Chitinophagaceae bacterium IBVUCB2]|nr:hypothetical protein CAP36_11360 [Chitinophagaceae bacterium IBVUCB2]
MKETVFYIVISIKTASGFEKISQFFIGDDKESVTDLFSTLKGDEDFDDANILLLELMEKKGTLPVNMRLIRCSLEELGDNCKLIIKHIFTHYNLKKP